LRPRIRSITIQRLTRTAFASTCRPPVPSSIIRQLWMRRRGRASHWETEDCVDLAPRARSARLTKSAGASSHSGRRGFLVRPEQSKASRHFPRKSWFEREASKCRRNRRDPFLTSFPILCIHRRRRRRRSLIRRWAFHNPGPMSSQPPSRRKFRQRRDTSESGYLPSQQGSQTFTAHRL
jgi:hypothetical protein